MFCKFSKTLLVHIEQNYKINYVHNVNQQVKHYHNKHYNIYYKNQIIRCILNGIKNITQQ